MEMTFTREGIEKLYGSPFAGGNSVELLWRDREAFERIFNVIRDAKEFICLEFYIFRNDDTGAELSEILKEKAKEGVGVYLLYDHLGSFGTPSSFWEELKKSGIKVSASHPFRLTSPIGYMHRDHRKLIIVDGSTAFIGGINIANEYRGIHIRRKEPWRDTGIIIKGPSAFGLLKTFKAAWQTWAGKPFTEELREPGHYGELPVMAIFAHSNRGRRKMRRLLYYSINHAKKDICLTTAYFTPGRRMIETLEAAVKRGARVRLLVPGISDVPAAYHAARAFFGRLLKAGVEIYSYQGQILHAKAYVFDGLWSIVGSANLDFQSLRWNDEGNAGILDEGFGKQMIEIFDADLKHSNPVDMESWKRRPFSDKLKERFFSLFRKRL
ncbi:MAG: phospholipase D-like domain-containing protein [Thermodesulfovibrionales bacterium]|nr:phospholipase D-like domain-containing protein [Thermodesulfovibrionales bacterium]